MSDDAPRVERPGSALPDAAFLLVDKPSGWTSHDVVAKVRRLARMRKVGHAGTLDPMATGLVVLGLGRATRLLRFVQDQPKEYEAEVTFGVATDTLDADGAVLEREPMTVERDELEAVLRRFTGTIMQVPPMVSALKVGGRRLYELAREGKEIEREPRPVEIHDIELLDLEPGPYPVARLRVRCGKGTYVRSLAADIAAALGGHAHLSGLRRTRIGSLSVDEAHTIEALEAAAEDGRLGELLLPPAEGLRDLPSLALPADGAKAVSHGMRFPRSTLPETEGVPPGTHVRMLAPDGSLLAVYRVDDAALRPEVVLV